MMSSPHIAAVTTAKFDIEIEYVLFLNAILNVAIPLFRDDISNLPF